MYRGLLALLASNDVSSERVDAANNIEKKHRIGLQNARPSRPTVAEIYLETSYIWTVTLFKSDLHFQIRFWINLYLAAAKFSSDVPSMLMLK